MSLARGALGTALLNAGSALLALGASVLLARVLGPGGYGDYAFAVSIAVLLAVAAKLGLPVLAVREAARYHAQQRWPSLQGFVRRATLAALAAAAGCIAGAVLWSLAAPGTTWIALPVGVIAAGSALAAVWSGALRGLQRVVSGHFTDQFFVLAVFLALAAAAAAAGRLDAGSALTLHACAALLAALAAGLLLRKALPAQARQASPSLEDAAAWRASAAPLLLISALQIVNTQADLFLLGLLASREDVGLYRVAVQGSHLVVFMLAAVNVALAPAVSRLHAAGDRAGLQRAATWAARVVLAVATPVAGALIVLGDPILGAVFGGEFRAAHLPLALLCAGQLASCLLGSVGLLLNMTGHERVTAAAFAWAALANVALNLALIPGFGPAGAAAATSLTLLAWNLVLCREVWRRLGVQSVAFPLPLPSVRP